MEKQSMSEKINKVGLKQYEIKLNESRDAIQKCYGKSIPEQSGIYIFFRKDEDGIRYAYIGQARHLLTRLAMHLNGYEQHIDLSLKKHGLFDCYNNPHGWQIHFIKYPENELNEKERYWIKEMAQRGFQLRNVTAGGQDTGKHNINPSKPPKTYRDGLSQGYNNARRDVAKLFKTYLRAEINGIKGKRSQNALNKFNEFIKGGRR